jgi:hypothetical protein
VHTNEQDSGHSFNTLFAEKCTGDYANQIDEALEAIDADDVRLNNASALVVKDYPLDPDNLVGSYYQQLDTAINEFCTARSGLPNVINDVFKDVYRTVFDEAPAGEFSGCLSKKL